MRGLYGWYSRRTPWIRRLLCTLLGFLAAGSILWFVPTATYITAPGAAVDTSRMVAVQGGVTRPGRLHMLIVTSQPANLFWYLYAKLDPRADLETPEEFLGEIEDYDKYIELTRRMMAESQLVAKAVALHEAGYGKGARSEGVEITDLATASPSTGYLVPGDIILELQGRPVASVAELRDVLLRAPAGRPVAVRIRRAKQEMSVMVPTGEHTDPERKGTAALGIFIKDYLTFDVPIPVRIKSGAITGPSAGLMFTLQIIDQLTPGGLTGNMVIAGTGTIEYDGRVGPIGGVRQKVFAAEVAGARAIFVPRENYPAAAAAATRIEVVPVGHVREALQWIEAHKAEGGA
ncbi:MAG TPA: S16 family serine protease [Symbiobacteriaceae bacterium]|nr:S16 family serine protease [Symbiobacteriaceae bacterium]